jgi:glycosyltransferase involved in cell wall biosynthesis
MNVTFCISQFDKSKVRLQPWLTFNEIATRLHSLGCEIHLITDVGSTDKYDGISVHSVESLRGTHSGQIERALSTIKPDCVIVSVTPLSLVTASWYRRHDSHRIFAYISYPFYTTSEYLRAFPHLDSREIWEYGRHQLVPTPLWRRKLTRSFDGIICQSERTSQRILNHMDHRIPIYTIPPGIDQSFWIGDKGHKVGSSSNTVLLYIGSAKRIRGFQLLLDALSLLSESGLRLRVMARGASDDVVREIRTEAARRNIEHQVDIQGGWLNSEDLRKEIKSADIVLMPFVLVPSVLPISVMEAMCCGTPVIVSDLDGLPEVAGDAGLVVTNGDIHSLMAAIKKIHKDRSILSALRDACARQMNKMRTWDEVSLIWQDVLKG